jgi:hypothetical protein
MNIRSNTGRPSIIPNFILSAFRPRNFKILKKLPPGRCLFFVSGLQAQHQTMTGIRHLYSCQDRRQFDITINPHPKIHPVNENVFDGFPQRDSVSSISLPSRSVV